MAVAFVKSLFQGSANAFGTSLALAGSSVISVGQTILVAFAQGSGSGSPSVADNLGNTYTLVKGSFHPNGYGAHLWRADVTKPGTLTTITITHPGISRRAAIATLFSGVDVLRATSVGTTIGSTSNPTAYPGPAEGTVDNYVANDLWVGVFSYYNPGSSAFSAFGLGDGVPSIEPTPEQIADSTINGNVGFLYFTSPTGLASRRLLGAFGAATLDYVSVGAAFIGKSGVVNNDTVAGAIVFTGTRTESWLKRVVYTDAPAAAFALAGTVVESNVVKKIYNDAPAGSTPFSGSVVESGGKGFTDARAGTLVLSGAKSESFRRTDAPSGSVALNGTVVESWYIHVGNSDAPTGAMGIAGSAVEVRRGTDKPTGRITLLGSSVDRSILRETPAGAIQLWGWAARTLPTGTPRPVGIPGAVANSAGIVVNPTILRPPLPKNYEIGDVLICFTGGGGDGQATLTAVPAGWTVGGPPIGVAGVVTSPLYLVGKVAVSLDEVPPTLAWQTTPGGGGAPVMARIIAFRNLDTRDMAHIADVVGDYNQAPYNSGQMVGGAAITTNYDNDLVLSLSQLYPNISVTSVSPPAGFGLLAWSNPMSGRRIATGWAYQVKNPAGLIAAPQFGYGGHTPNIQDASAGVLVALKGYPAAVETSTPTGTLRLSGSTVERKGYPDKPQGTIALAGTVVEKYLPPTVEGTLPLSGTVQESWTHVGAVTGRIALAGSVVEKRSFVDLTSGSLSVTGTVKENQRNSDICAGVLKLIGVLSQSLVVSVSPSGAVRLAGRNSEFIVFDGKIIYTDFPAGLVEIDGRIVFVSEEITPGRDGRVVPGLETGRIVRQLNSGRVVGNLTGRLTS